MKRKPQLTKREKKAAAPARPAAPRKDGHAHIHCIACGRHLDPADFEAPATAVQLTCDHGSTFTACVRCMPKAKAAIEEHDRTGRPVQTAQAWH